MCRLPTCRGGFLIPVVVQVLEALRPCRWVRAAPEEVVEDRYSGGIEGYNMHTLAANQAEQVGGFGCSTPRMVFVRHGCDQLILMVIDEFGRGVPVGYCVATKENESARRGRALPLF